VLIVVGIVLAVCAVGAVAGGFLLFRSIQTATAPARDAADQFVRKLEAGDVSGAYGMLCRSTRERFTFSAFERGVRDQPHISSHEIVGVNVSNVNGRQSGQVTVDLTLDSGFTERHSFLMVPESGQWKVCGNPY